MPQTRTLQQVIAVERRMRQADNDFGKLVRGRLTQARVNGQVLEYKPDIPDDQIQNPSEKGTLKHQPVQSFVNQELAQARRYAVDAINIVATKDWTNMLARADLLLPDGTVLKAGVPIGHLLWLEDYLNEWRATLAALPVNSSVKNWTLDPNSEDLWKAEPEMQVKTKKKTVPLVLHEGNDRHPPQAIPDVQDVGIGRNITTLHSGAIPELKRRELTDRCDTLIKAVRDAIARADQTQAVEVTDEGAAIMGFILG